LNSDADEGAGRFKISCSNRLSIFGAPATADWEKEPQIDATAVVPEMKVLLSMLASEMGASDRAIVGKANRKIKRDNMMLPKSQLGWVLPFWVSGFDLP
jgi:hypothetical protein